MSVIYVNSIKKNPSLCDGPGYRTVLFLQGCNLHCKGCQNKSTWDIQKGTPLDTHILADVLRKKCFNKKLTISGGEPLMQKEALLNLVKELKDFDLCLYTGHSYDDVPKELLSYFKYVKTGPFILSEKTTTRPYVGSWNQEMIEVRKEDGSSSQKR